MTDICERKHGGNPQSIAAYGTGKSKEAQRWRVLEAIRDAGDRGLTCDELAAQWATIGMHSVADFLSLNATA